MTLTSHNPSQDDAAALNNHSEDGDLSPDGAILSGLRRPDSHLMLYYALASLLLGPFFPIGWVVGYFRYHSLKYRFDDEGVTMSWGVLFRREISLTYARLQDIHLASNLIERWLGLARVQLQTAAGSAVAEMTIEGLPDFERVRDVLYSKMRDSRGQVKKSAPCANLDDAEPSDLDEVTLALRQATAELQALRRELSRRQDAKP